MAIAAVPQSTSGVLATRESFARISEVLPIPNLIDVSAYPFRCRTAARPRLFWMRSFHAIYNPGMAIRVLARLRSTMPEASLVMASQDDRLEHSVRAEAERLGLENAVRFAGFLDAAGKAREGMVTDVFLNTNRIDNAPVAVIEAWAMGLPVVSTDVGGLKDLIRDGETGLLVPDGDVEAMTNAIVRLVGDPTLTGRLSTNGRREAAQCSWAQVGPQWERLFQQLHDASGVDRANVTRERGG